MQTTHLDRWHEAGDVRFLFGMDLTADRHIDADDLPKTAWIPLRGHAREVAAQPRQRPHNVKQEIVDERQFADVRLASEEVAEIRSAKCSN